MRITCTVQVEQMLADRSITRSEVQLQTAFGWSGLGAWCTLKLQGHSARGQSARARSSHLQLEASRPQCSRPIRSSPLKPIAR